MCWDFESPESRLAFRASDFLGGAQFRLVHKAPILGALQGACCAMFEGSPIAGSGLDRRARQYSSLLQSVSRL